MAATTPLIAGPGLEGATPALVRGARRQLRPWLILVGLDAAATLSAWVAVILGLSQLPFGTAVLLAVVATAVTLGSLASRQLYREHVRRVLAVEVSGLARASFVAAVAVGVSDDVLGHDAGLGVAMAGFAAQLALLFLDRGGARTVVRAARRAGRFQQRVRSRRTGPRWPPRRSTPPPTRFGGPPLASATKNPGSARRPQRHQWDAPA